MSRTHADDYMGCTYFTAVAYDLHLLQKSSGKYLQIISYYIWYRRHTLDCVDHELYYALI